MKKQIVGITACVALCAAVWPQSVEVGDLPAEPVKAAVNAEINHRPEKKPQILLSADTPAPEEEYVTESDLPETNITAEEETGSTLPVEPTPRTVSKSTHASTKPKSGDRAVRDGKPYIWIPGFGWIVDEGGGSVGTTVGNLGDEITGNKAGQMGGATVGSNGDINKRVGIMGRGTVAQDMFENGHKIGIMGSEESAPHETNAAPAEQPVPSGDDIYIELQPPVTKDSTPPPYKPGEAPPNPK